MRGVVMVDLAKNAVRKRKPLRLDTMKRERGIGGEKAPVVQPVAVQRGDVRRRGLRRAVGQVAAVENALLVADEEAAHLLRITGRLIFEMHQARREIDHRVGKAIEKSGHAIDVPNFGKIYLATLTVEQSDYDTPTGAPRKTTITLNMIEMVMGCVGVGNLMGGGGKTNGGTAP